jgi:hypothetical protein
MALASQGEPNARFMIKSLHSGQRDVIRAGAGVVVTRFHDELGPGLALGRYRVLIMASGSRPARADDVHELAGGMPHVTVAHGGSGNAVYQVGGKSFVFFRTPRPDAVDPATGERYADVIVFWVATEGDKQALVQDEASPFFTTPHFDGHLSVLIRGSRVGELTLRELTEVVQDAWLSRASRARATAWLNTHKDQ